MVTTHQSAALTAVASAHGCSTASGFTAPTPALNDWAAALRYSCYLAALETASGAIALWMPRALASGAKAVPSTSATVNSKANTSSGS